MTDTKLEPELPQEVPHDVAAAFFRERDKLNIIKDGTVAHLIAVGAVKDALSAIEADRNKRAPVGSLTDEQVLELAKNAGFYSDDSLSAEFPNGYAEVQRRTIAFARALLSSVAPRVPESIAGYAPYGVVRGGLTHDKKHYVDYRYIKDQKGPQLATIAAPQPTQEG